MENKYFATLPREEIASACCDKVTDFYEEIDSRGRLGLWRKCHRFFFALDTHGSHEASGIQRSGAQGELSLLKANHYRNLLMHLHVLVTQNRAAFDCRALNTDYKSQVQTILGRNILEYYVRERRLDVQFRQAAEYALVYGEAYIEIAWDKDAGEAGMGDADEEGNPNGESINVGDIVARVYDPINVIRRCRNDNDGKQDWYILRRWESRYDLAAKHPEFADQILDYAEDTPENRLYYVGNTQSNDTDEDTIPVYTLYHDRTPACPEGRVVKFLGPEMCLEYGTLTYKDMPVYNMIPSQQHGTSFGYSVGFDLLVVQESIDLLYSTILSNQSTFGVQNIWMKPGSNLVPNQLGGGLNILESMEKPEPINLTNTPPEIFNFLKGLETLGEVLSGINSVARGQPEASLKSGSALALVASQAVQFSNGLQAAFVRLEEDCATGIIRTLQTRAVLPRAAVIAGKDNKSFVKDFVGQDLKDLNRVVIDMANPMSQTLSGRVEMANQLLQNQQIKRPEQYMQVITTGNLDPMIDDERNEQLLINAENEALREGRPVVALIIDEHLQHIKNHKSVLSDPESRFEQGLSQRVLDHIQEHLDLLASPNIALLNALGQAPLSVPPGQPGGAPPPQGPNAPQPNQAPQSEQVQAPAGSPQLIQANMPDMPVPAA